MLLLVPFSLAASLDNIEIGGPWGTPTSTDGTAGWWNPAGFAAEKGTRIELEAAYEDAKITFNRDDPHGGKDTYTLSGVPPFLGLSSTVGNHVGPGKLGVGLVFALPYTRGGNEVNEPGSGHFHMKQGDSKALWIGGGVAYDVKDVFSIGVTGAIVQSSWAATVDQDSYPDLRQAIIDQGGEALMTAKTDADLEDPNYTAKLDFGGPTGGISGNGELSDTQFSFAAGLLFHPNPRFAIGLTYVNGATVTNTGPVVIEMGCPADSDVLERTVAQSRGLCNTTIHGQGSVGYTLPRRVMGGVMFKPMDNLRMEAMGAWVQWSQYDDFHIKVYDTDIEDEESKALIEQTRDWARDNEDSFWVSVDGKAQLTKRWTVGARYWFDRAAVPDKALSTNNWDADEHIVSALLAYQPANFLQIGLSYTHHFVGDRTTDTSAFFQTIEGDAAEDRYNYPHSNGTYTGSIDRIGLQLRGSFGQNDGAEKGGKKGKKN